MMKCPIRRECAIGDQTVEVRVPVNLAAAKGLNGHDHPWNNSVILHRCVHHLFDGFIGTTAQSPEKPSVVSEVCPKYLRDAEDVVSVSDGFQDLITDPLGKGRRAFCMAGGAEGAGLAGEAQEIFTMAVIAVDAGKAIS